MHCVILGSRPLGEWARRYIRPGAFLIAADAGWLGARALGLEPDLVLGDFDTAPPPPGGAVLRTPAEKDDTDTMLAIRTAIGRGAESLVMLGALGGRPDHTFANLQALQYCAARGVENLAADQNSEMCCLAPGCLRLARQPGRYLSVFAVGGDATGVDLENVRYPLHQAHLRPEFPLGVSNEFAGTQALIRHRTGYLLVMTTEMD